MLQERSVGKFSVFEEKVGPHYKRITDLEKHNINIVSLDCDGCMIHCSIC